MAEAAKPVGTAGARSLLGAGATSVLVGIGLSAGGSPELGSWITVGALVLMIYGLHRFGRSGPDAPSIASPSSKRRPKRKKAAADPAAEP